jgi:hypothetical protein
MNDLSQHRMRCKITLKFIFGTDLLPSNVGVDSLKSNVRKEAGDKACFPWNKGSSKPLDTAMARGTSKAAGMH